MNSKLSKVSYLTALLFIITSSLHLNAQKQNPKTRYLINQTNPLNKTDTLAFIPPYIFSGTTKNYAIIDSSQKMYFNDNPPDIDTANNFKGIQTYYQACCYFWYRMQFDPSAKFYNLQLYKFKPYPDSEMTIPAATKQSGRKNTFIVDVSPDDYTTIHTELNKIENKLNDSSLLNLPISNLLYQTLSKYTTSLCVLTHVKEYEYIGNKLGKKHASLCLYRVFIVDVKKKNLYFYNSEISGNDMGTEYTYRLPVGIEKRSPRENFRLKAISNLIGSKLKRE